MSEDQMGEKFERALPQQAPERTAERSTTTTADRVEMERVQRYFLAQALCRGLDVVDVASGAGDGSALLAQGARSVVGIELSEKAVAYARRGHVAPNLRYRQGDARKLPLDDASVDAVVSFETLEHFVEHDLFIAEVRRVLRPTGFLILSSPERDAYFPLASSANPHHLRALSRLELEALLKGRFRNVVILPQRPLLGSTLIADDAAGISGALTFECRGEKCYGVSQGFPRPPYNIAIASEAELPNIPNSAFIETSEFKEMLARAESRVAPRAALHGHTEQTDALAASLRREIEAARETIKAQVERAEKAEAALALAQSGSRAAIEGLRSELAQVRSELAVASVQRDVLRASFRGHVNLLAESRFKKDVAFKERRQRDADWEGRVAELESKAAEWEQRYMSLRRRLEAILRRFGILRMSRLCPRPLRAFVRDRILGPGRAR